MTLEAWQRGPVSGYEPLLMPVVHALIQVREEAEALAARLPPGDLWRQPPGGAASVGFHLRHIAGATERLLTYARGERLSAAQLEAARREGSEQPDLGTVLVEVHGALACALVQVRATKADTLLHERTVGRAALPSTVIGLLFHAAEHATRHMGQAITTARIVAGTPAP